MANLTNTPFTGRRNSQSSIDFMFWVVQQAPITQLTGKAPTRTDDDRALSSVLVEYASSQVGIGMPSGAANVRGFCTDQGTIVTQAVALAIRGALLFVDGAVLVSMGDSKRVVDVRGGQHFIRFVERNEVFTSAAKVPYMRYR